MSARGAIDEYPLLTEHSHQKYLKAISTRESQFANSALVLFQLNMRGEDFGFDYLCDTLLSSSFWTVTLDFAFYINPQIKLFMQFEKRLLVL